MIINCFIPVNLSITIISRVIGLGCLGCFFVACSGYFSSSEMNKSNADKGEVLHLFEKYMKELPSRLPSRLPSLKTSLEEKYKVECVYANGFSRVLLEDYAHPLFNAVEKGDIDSVKYLLSTVDRSDPPRRLQSYREAGLLYPVVIEYSLLEMALDLYWSTKSISGTLVSVESEKQRAIVMSLIEHEAIDVNAQNEDGNTPLMISVNKNDDFYLPIIEALIARGAYINATNKRGQTVLDKAFENISRFKDTYLLENTSSFKKKIYLLFANGAVPSLLVLKTLLESYDFDDQEKKTIIEMNRCFLTEELRIEMATFRCSQALKEYIKNITFSPKPLSMLASQTVKNRLENPTKDVKRLKALPEKLQRMVIDAP